jgi:hypothetical protein
MPPLVKQPQSLRWAQRPLKPLPLLPKGPWSKWVPMAALKPLVLALLWVGHCKRQPGAGHVIEVLLIPN